MGLGSWWQLVVASVTGQVALLTFDYQTASYFEKFVVLHSFAKRVQIMGSSSSVGSGSQVKNFAACSSTGPSLNQDLYLTYLIDYQGKLIHHL
ncbi:hypothetical protein HanXRQr2_Chr03g0098281 [Helianthus annuus]|uniref:WD40/YVTN repeat-like-containing domain-containing protein n=1 Tax=Helianthus annuus TaxID=4232 RepID=A0A9K3JF02_HELAN|nr:hypothetical protein HanXRQr2_Chr03g0098281 [Helianthus annuus]